MPLAFQHVLGKRKVLDKSRRGSSLDQFGPYIFAVFGRLGYIYIYTFNTYIYTPYIYIYLPNIYIYLYHIHIHMDLYIYHIRTI